MEEMKGKEEIEWKNLEKGIGGQRLIASNILNMDVENNHSSNALICKSMQL